MLINNLLVEYFHTRMPKYTRITKKYSKNLNIGIEIYKNMCINNNWKYLSEF